ncbi:MAG TPA: flotillin domain-containing protein, partial [Thermomicrobiales bacterium]|nr:flotillin domain-containing protein [Thermomicrobiales bacterium]
KEPEMVADRMRANVADDMEKMGLVVVSFTIKEVKDKNDYILNMGKPDIALVKGTADVATAEADRDTAIKRAQALRESRIAEAVAEQERVIAETASQTRQAEAHRDLEVKRAEYDATVKSQQAAADKSYEIQSNVEQQRVVAEAVKVEQVRKLGEVQVQDAEIQRREKELIATVLRPAEIEKKRIETIADADRQRQILQATGQSEATKMTGLAEASIIKAKGEAEADAMHVKASAYQQYNQAAILDKLFAAMPELVRAISEPLTKVDKITVVSTGDGDGQGAGMNRVTSDMATMIAQVPALLQGLTGIDLTELMKQVPQMRSSLAEPSNGHASKDGGAPAASDGADAKAVATLPKTEENGA